MGLSLKLNTVFRLSRIRELCWFWLTNIDIPIQYDFIHLYFVIFICSSLISRNEILPTSICAVLFPTIDYKQPHEHEQSAITSCDASCHVMFFMITKTLEINWNWNFSSESLLEWNSWNDYIKLCPGCNHIF